MNKEHENNNKKARLVWSVELHRKFVASVNQLGIHKSVPRKILALMNDEKLTKENVSSHLQKYKLHLKRMSTCVPNQQQGSLSDDSGQFLNNADQTMHQLPSSGTNHQFGQNNHNTNGQYNFQSSIGHVVEVIPISEWFSNQCPHSLTEANTSTNSPFNGNLDFDFCDPLQTKHDGTMELTEQNSILNQHRSQNSYIVNNLGSVEDLVTASASCSQQSQASAEIAELRQEMAATRDEHRKLREIVQAVMARQDMLMKAVLQVVPPDSLAAAA